MKRFTKIHLGKEVKLTDGTQGTLVEVIDKYGNLAYVQKADGKKQIIEFNEMVREPKDTWKHGKRYYKADYAAPESAEEFMARVANAMEAGVTSSINYENPFALQFMYYTEGMSLKDMAEYFECHTKTITRWMNYYGLNRRQSGSAQLVATHGVEMAEIVGKIRYNKCYKETY